MTLDIGGIAGNPLRVVVFFLLLLVIRGLPSLLIYRKVLPLRQRDEMTFITATALPLLVALTRAVVAATARLTDAVPVRTRFLTDAVPVRTRFLTDAVPVRTRVPSGRGSCAGGTATPWDRPLSSTARERPRPRSRRREGPPRPRFPRLA